MLCIGVSLFYYSWEFKYKNVFLQPNRSASTLFGHTA